MAGRNAHPLLHVAVTSDTALVNCGLAGSGSGGI